MIIRRKRILIICIGVLVMYFVIYRCIQNLYLIFATPENSKLVHNHEELHAAGGSDETRVCKIPSLDPFNPEFMEILGMTKSKAPCVHKVEMKFRADHSSNLVRVPGNEAYWPLVTCCYFTYTRGDDDMKIKKNSNQCYPITENETSIPADHEFITVTCKKKDSDKTDYKDYFGFVHLKPEVEQRASAHKVENKPDQLSVIILGLDSVSQMNFQRYMPNTREYLRDNLSAIEFLGRNKIHESTFANLGPTLTGWTNDELTSTVKCWPNPPNTYFDKCPFIWKEFEDRGYRTLYGEDSIHRSIFLDSTLIGFEKPIADYDFRTLIRGMELQDDRDGCFKHQDSPTVLIDSVAKAALTLRDRLYFHFTWITSFTHEYAQATKYVDNPVLNLLKYLNEQDLLNKTAFILASDHGMTFGTYVQHEQGMLESRMPMLSIVLPKWFRTKYSKAIANLQTNAKRLSTPFDLHEMLKDLLDPSETISNSVLKRRETEFCYDKRGISLFLPIPINRTCAMAGIDDHWCICWSKTPVTKPETNPDVIESVNFSLSTLNSKILNFPMCAQLTLNQIVLARQLNPESLEIKKAHKEKVKKYEVVFEVQPSQGIFEATVVLGGENGPKMGGPISRINAYKQQGDCIDLTLNGTLEVKSMCFCGAEIYQN